VTALPRLPSAPVATQAEVSAWAAEQEALTTLVAAEFASQAADLVVLDPAVAAGLIRELSAEIADEFGRAASLLAAEWYEDLRPTPGFDATLLDPDIDKLQVDLGWAMRDLFAEEPDFSSALSLSEQVTDLSVTNTGRGTVITNARRDPLEVRYTRHASANACAFCAMLASRQAVYRSEDSAGVDAHRKCHCTVVPVWPGQAVEEAPYVAQFRDDYYAAKDAARAQGNRSTKAILAEMRLLGYR
jgi:hypothetical protein